eukprot:2676966-Amphidinium_carterae.1
MDVPEDRRRTTASMLEQDCYPLPATLAARGIDSLVQVELTKPPTEDCKQFCYSDCLLQPSEFIVYM